MQQGFPQGRTGIVAAAFAVQREMEEREEETRVRQPRTAEELIALGDGHFDQFTDEEVTILFQHLREQSMLSPEYDELEWRMLHAQLRCFEVMVDVFANNPEATADRKQLSRVFHGVWTKHRNGYRKMGWKVFRKQLIIRGIHV